MIKANELKEYINTKLLAEKSSEISNDSLLFKDRFLDSITVLSLIGYIEQKLGRRLKEEEIKLENFASVQAITNAFHE